MKTETSFETAVKLLLMSSLKQDVVKEGQQLGLSKSTVYMMIKAAKKFIEYDVDEGGFCSIFKSDKTDYKLSQLTELNTLDIETAKRLHETNQIKPEMNAKKIREVVRQVNFNKQIGG